MTDNEKELISLVRNHSNPEKALEVAIKIILEFLEQDGSSQEQPPSCYQVSA